MPLHGASGAAGAQGHLSAKLSPTNRGYSRSDGLPATDGPDPAKWTHLAVRLPSKDLT